MELRLLDIRLTQMTKRAYKQRHASPTAMIHEDPANFGMGCTSLLVDYTHACIKQLTGALNDTTRYGEVSRAILTHQMKLTGGMMETEIITASRSMMRIRQASALQQSNLVLQNRTTGQEIDLEANTLVQKMRQIFNCGHSNPTDQPYLHILIPLLSLGVSTITDLTSSDGNRLINPADLKRKYGKKVTTKHTNALCKLAHILHSYPTQPPPTHIRHESMAIENTWTIAPEHMEMLNLRSDKNEIKTLLELLSRHKRLPQSHMHESQENLPDDPTTTHPDKPSKRRRTSRIRQPAQAGHRITLFPEAPSAQTNNIPADRSYLARSEKATRIFPLANTTPPYTQEQRTMAKAALEQLIPLDHSIPEAITSHHTNTAYTDASSKKKGLATLTQTLYEVCWKPTVEEGWSLTAYQAAGYRPASITPTDLQTLEHTYPDLYNTLSCEICGGQDEEDTLYI